MIKRGEFYGENAFEIAQSAVQRVPFVFNSPHSGRNYPKSLRNASRLSDHALRQSEDVMVDELFLPVVEIGAPLLSAKFPRAWLDVNREPFELDPKLFAETVPPHANSRSIRVAGGLGTIPRIVAENQEIYAVAPTLEEALDRIETVYRPYHAALRRLIAKTAATFGHAVLVEDRAQVVRVDVAVVERDQPAAVAAVGRAVEIQEGQLREPLHQIAVDPHLVVADVGHPQLGEVIDRRSQAHRVGHRRGAGLELGRRRCPGAALSAQFCRTL